MESSPKPLPKTEPELIQKQKKEPKPVVEKIVKPVPIKKTPKKPIPLKQIQAATPAPSEENKVSSPITNVVAASKQTKVETKRQVKDKNKSSIIYNPTYQKQRPIKYPKSAKRRKLEGTVMIRAAIDSNGRVKQAWVHESSGHPALDRSALKSVRRWIFTPAQQGDLSIASTVQFPVVFELR